ncbi:MAG: hypothetical protein Q4D02_08530 [Clostridia bacterium]|nr:hypothetical protein [Clostridia bacterium]
METEEKMKKKGKRNVSILTVFLWLALIAVMSVITITGINKSNALEVVRTITVKVDFNEFLQDESIEEENKEPLIENFLNYYFWMGKNKYNGIDFGTRYIGLENDIATYEVDIGSEDVNCMGFWMGELLSVYSVLSNNELLEVVNDYDNFFVEKLNSDQDIYEFSLSRRDAVRINIDISEGVEEVIGIGLMYHDSLPLGGNLVEESVSHLVYEIYPLPNMEYNIVVYTTKNMALEEDKVLNISEEDENIYYKRVSVGEEKSQYFFKLKEIVPGISSRINWKEDGTAVLNLQLKRADNLYSDIISGNSYYQCAIFVENLDENFTISDQYENDPEWLIATEEELINEEEFNSWGEGMLLEFDLDNNEYITRYIYHKFFSFVHITGSSTNRGTYKMIYGNTRYIYLKDKNILYCLVEPNGTQTIDLVCKEKNQSAGNRYNFEAKIINFYCSSGFACMDYWHSQYYIGGTFSEKAIKYNEDENTRIAVNKLVSGEKGNHTYYVGLFENETDEKTERIYNIDTVDGVGSTTIDMTGYDSSKEYYIYEVDENGNKIVDESLIYNKNRVLEEENIIKESVITSDKSIISSVSITSPDEPGIGSGEEFYDDNVITVTNVYQDIVTITKDYKEKVYIVRYETEEGGTFNGDTEEIVGEGETPVNVPKVELNENYEFDKWVVIKDGEEIEVNPSEYVITEDVTFIAKYKKIEGREPIVKPNENEEIDTGDIAIEMYIGSAIISIALIIIILIVIRKKKHC